MKEEALRSMGLQEKEINVYLANLQLGSSLVNDIARRSRLNRTSTYDILSSLEKKGFVSFTISSGKRYYQATNPKQLLDLLREKENLIKKAMPELKTLAESVVKKPKVQVYTGANGLKTLIEMLLTAKKSFDGIVSKKSIFRLFKYYFPHFVKRRIQAGIKVRLIIDAPPVDRKAPYRLIKGPIKTGMWLFDNKIVMMSLEEKEPIGMLIEEKNFYETQKHLFDLLWKNLPKPKDSVK